MRMTAACRPYLLAADNATVTNSGSMVGVTPAFEFLAHPNNLTGRSGTPQDVANAFLWLASPAGSWVSGQTIQVAGGGRRVKILPGG
jgi:7-alpha-hydroxysteroid dehydrogenase